MIEFGLTPPGPFSTEGTSGFELENEDFSLGYHRVDGEKPMQQNPDAFALLTVVAGEGAIRHRGRIYPLQYGDSYLLPACLGQYDLCGNMGLLIGVPNRPLILPEAKARPFQVNPKQTTEKNRLPMGGGSFHHPGFSGFS